ncbi:MAG: Phenylacetic acid catabolic protein [Actinomycetota bacterium]
MPAAAPLILAWCDDEFLQGHQLSAWITDYVDVEESLAVGSMAQDHLAHAAALLGACGFTAVDRDGHIYERPASEWYPSRLSLLPEHDWPATVVRQLLFNRATLVMRRYLQIPDRPRMQQLAELVRAEQDVHSTHWERWVRILASDDELSEELADRLKRAADDAADLFGLPEGAKDPDVLLVGASRAEMQHQWAEEVSATLERLGAAVPPLPVDPVPRAPGHIFEALAGILAELRFSRGPEGARPYEVYR